MMMFLYSEDWFERKDFELIQKLMPWDKKAFDNALRDGWIVKKREQKLFTYGTRYSLSRQSKNIVEEVYRKLLGEEELPSLDGKSSYSAKRFNLVRERMNAKQQQQRPPLESRYKKPRQ